MTFLSAWERGCLKSGRLIFRAIGSSCREDFIRGLLYTRDFLEEGIAETPAWAGLANSELEIFRTTVRAIFERFPIDRQPNEPTTEQDLIFPVLRALGWEHFLPQQTASHRREDVPDALLFADSTQKAAANRERRSPARYRHGIAIVENKAWDLPLDRGPPDLFHQNAPSTQMLRYLSRVEIESERAIQWGILTNGRLWRLYFQGARSRAEEFLELDLPLLAGVPAIQPDLFSPERQKHAHLLKVFYLMFHRSYGTKKIDAITVRAWMPSSSGYMASDLKMQLMFWIEAHILIRFAVATQSAGHRQPIYSRRAVWAAAARAFPT